MRLRKAEANTYVEQDYYQIELKEIIDKKKICKKIMYNVEWKDGRQEWVLQKKIEHEVEKLNEFESNWWRNKRKMDKNLIMEKSFENFKEDFKENEIEVKKDLIKLKGKKINLYDKLDKEILVKNTIKMNNDNINISPSKNLTINETKPAELGLDKQDINFFEIKKIMKTSSSPKRQIKGTTSIKSNQSNSEKKKKTMKSSRNTDIEQMLNNKRYRINDDDKEVIESHNVGNLPEEIPKINSTQINIIDWEEIIETEYLVLWKKRDDGTIPNPSFIGEKEAKEKYANLLIDFLSNTLKDKDIKKLDFPLNN